MTLASQEQAFDFSTLDLLPYGIIVVDAEGTVLFYNEREEQIAARRRAEVLGRNFFTEIAPCTRVQQFHGQFMRLLTEGHGTARFNFRFPVATAPRDVEITLTPFEHEGRRLCLIAVNDLTAQAGVRQRVLESERFRELGEVAAGVAHNFGNLLQVINGATELLMHRSDLPEPVVKRLRMIAEAAQDGTQLVGRVRRIARRQQVPAAFEPVELGRLTRDAVEWSQTYARDASRERHAAILVCTAAVPEAWVRGSATELREVLLNLLRNAVDALASGGSVTARVEAGPDLHTITVEDTGTGMSPDVLEQLFRPMFTTKGDRGSGFGLATAYAIIQAHGGRIEVDSTPGRGSAFYLRLPAQA